MENLRISNVKTISSTTIVATFSDSLTKNLVTSNVEIKSETPNVPDPKVISINVSKNTLNIECQPLTDLAGYFVYFKSVTGHPFTSVNGSAKIIEDDVANKYFIIGPVDPDNPVQLYLNNFLKDGVYNLENTNSLISNYIRSLSENLSRALYDIRQLGNENYLSLDVIDEKKIRGEGPFDRLLEEGAYDVFRVGRTRTGFAVSKKFSYEETPYYPITLQQESAFQSLTSDSVNEAGKFNINDLILNLNNSPVTKLKSVVFTLNTNNPTFTYNIPELGYQILDSRYDQEYGFSYALLANNQIKLNSEILSDPLFALDKIIKVDVEYEFKNEGVVVDTNSVSVYTVRKSIREVLPPIINIFNLKYAPIVTANASPATLGGVTFTDPNTNVPNSKHPAFITEIPFRLNGLPSIPGQYAIDYPTGTVYVYGADLNNDGTGPYPPLATYNYKFFYKLEQDYAYDDTTRDLVALPLGNLLENAGTIEFKYEQVLVPNVDYVANVHKENMQERIENRLLALNSLRVKNSPITNIFRIYNETSGEIYTIDRWNGDRVYFRYLNPPNVQSKTKEKIKLKTIENELLFVDSSVVNTSSRKVFIIKLSNNRLGATTEDSQGMSTNTSVVFSKPGIFKSEKWFNRELTQNNLQNLTVVGEYCIDYENGIVYCAVSNTQDNNIGTITYKYANIVPEYPHLISVEDIYYQIDPLGIKNKQFSYTSFEDGSIIPTVLEYSDELYLNNNTQAAYQLYNGNVGIFVNAGFLPGVSQQVSFVRGLFEFNDLTNSTNPINFANYTTADNFNITVNSLSKQVFDTIQFDGTNFYVNINENIPYFSPNITFNFSVIRSSDSAQLWNNTGTVVPGNPVKLILPGINVPVTGQLVNITYTFTINNVSRVVVDYSKGEYLLDYTYLADEIIVSYEYGDNVLDFRQNTSLPAGSEYFVSYRYGALRDALLKNFGDLVNIPELTNFNIEFNRERYRDALVAAMGSFIQGPTVKAIKNIGKKISHIDPKITESVFENWSLGSSLLFPEGVSSTGSFQLLPAKFSNGVLIDSPDQTITFSASSNLRLEEGTFETWVAPQWNGIDNDAELTFLITKDGYDGYGISNVDVFIGSSEYHPQIVNGSFKINKNSGAIGTPNFNKDGIYIYYDQDVSGNFNRWYVRVIDGYVTPGSSSYKFKITSTGGFYDSKSIVIPKPYNLSIFTGTNSITFTLGSSIAVDSGITFVSDIDHYLLDFGVHETEGRLSVFKDISGYMNFRVYDVNRNMYLLSADVSSWRSGELHQVAVSWKLNNPDSRDEMHLFIDGLEVPNIIRYGQKLKPYLHEKFRTVDPEELVGLANRDIVGSDDLITTSGSNSVTSSINFSTYNIFVGDTIFIDEIGFDTNGYTILAINGQMLTLSASMPLTLQNGRFSVNRTQFTVTSEIDIASNITVSTISPIFKGSDAVTTAGSNIISSASYNFQNQGVLPGYLIRVNDPNFEISYNIVQVSGNTVTITDNLSISLTNAQFQVYAPSETEIPGLRAVDPSYSISKDVNYNNILTISNNVFAEDLILVRLLGLNYRNFTHKYYVWGNNVENIIRTRLPAPISLDEAVIKKIILPVVPIGPANSTLVGGVFVSNNLSASQPTNSQSGRTIAVTIAGNNTDFSTPVTVTINGVTGIFTVSETITFTDYGTLNFVNPYISVNYIQVNAKPINTLKPALTIEAKEKYSMTYAELSALAPVVKYSYIINDGLSLYKDGYDVVTDGYNAFSTEYINNYLIITYPIAPAGYYVITGVSSDLLSLTVQPTTAAPPLPIPNFVDGYYQIVKTTDYRSGLQNGFFTFEVNKLPSQAYYLSSGFYELKYSTYTKIKMPPLNMQVFLGSNFKGKNQFNGVVDQVKIYSVMLTDTRVGETIPNNQRSITKDFNSLKPLRKDPTTLMLLNFDTYPFTNNADYYINTTELKNYFQSSIVVNENFGNSTVLLNKPIILSNDGILDAKKQGTIEFWMNPIFDTGNDPNERYYFDAYGAVLEEAVSVDNVSVKINSPIAQVLSVKLKYGDPNIDYFVGGKVEIDTQNAIQEEAISIGNSVVTTSKNILQVVKVQIIGDLTNTDYFDNGAIGPDKKTIYLGKVLPTSNLPLLVTYKPAENQNKKLNTQVIRLNRKLPNQNSQVIVNYIPQGLQGDRLSIFKDKLGYMNFSITASGNNYTLRAPIFWSKNTWHRVKASYKINSGVGFDEMRLFLDGYQYSRILFTEKNKAPIYLATPGFKDGYEILPNIKFKDPINELYIGTQYDQTSPVFSLIDNLRISDIFRPIYAPYGDPIDVNYNSNLQMAFPVTPDLYTTYLLDFDTLVKLNTDFSVLRNRNNGYFDFTVNILDSFGIVNSSPQVQAALEKLIKVLKPANSKVFIQYTR